MSAAGPGAPLLVEVDPFDLPEWLGETDVVGTPERVVVLDTGELDTALALGVTPVGAVRTDVSDDLPDYLEAAGADPAEITSPPPEPR